ncbi:hypothetical protein R1sor_016434 [Riccia sorocarpa]|uniref:Rhodanese domain-containing protein n=1 Tax=Riccia sorocarpa TaxID=122646 RepID=A0ABD3HJ32_9MARC
MNLFDLMVFMLLNWNSWSVEDLVTVILQDRPESEDSFWAVIQTICSGDLDERPRRDWWVFPKSECWWENLVKQVPEKTLTVPTAHTSSNGRRSRSDRITIKPYIVGDAAYPLTPHIIKAFNTRRTSTAEKNDFDKALRRCRVRIEHTFGLLKSRWKIVDTGCPLRIEEVPDCVMACCVLHNFVNYGGVSIREADRERDFLDFDPFRSSEPFLDIQETANRRRRHRDSENRQLHNNFAGLLYGLAYTKPNPVFIQQVTSKFEDREQSKLLLVCQEGLRSGYATEKLEGVGFKNVAYINAGLNKVPPGVFSKEGEKELQDAGKGGLVTIQGPVSRVVGIILILAYLFLQFFPDQATEEFRRR